MKEATVRGWVKRFKSELSSLGTASSSTDITELNEKKRGRPLLVGEDVDYYVKQFLCEVQDCGGVVNTTITLATAKGIILAKDSNLLIENGRHIDLTKEWAQRLMSRMGLVKSKASTGVKVDPEVFKDLQTQFLSDIRTVVKMMDIPLALIINWDQTAIKYVPVSNWTQEVKGSKCIEIACIDDKTQITAMLAATAGGKFLPAQVIYGGKTPAYIPKVDFPSSWHITYTANHWANEDTVLGYIHSVLVPYIVDTHTELKLPQSSPALAIFDHFSGQLTERVKDVLESNNILFVDVPPNCTDQLQPMDIIINKSIKASLKAYFSSWYASVSQ